VKFFHAVFSLEREYTRNVRIAIFPASFAADPEPSLTTCRGKIIKLHSTAKKTTTTTTVTTTRTPEQKINERATTMAMPNAVLRQTCTKAGIHKKVELSRKYRGNLTNVLYG